MSDRSTNREIEEINVVSFSVALGVWWYVWGIYGFWWGVCYGLFWPIWIGYRLAAYLLAVHP